MISLMIIGRLLDYPDEPLWAAREELMRAPGAAGELTLEQAARLTGFIDGFCALPLLDAQEAYCALFDRGRATSLLLFEHVHGESRDRGQAMVDLLEQYRAAGLELDSRELPDFLPLYLEYLSSRTEAQGRAGLADIAPILALLGARLRARREHYALLFDVLLALSGSELPGAGLDRAVAGEARDDTPAALDAVWEEEQVKFMAPPDCPTGEQARHQRRFAGAVIPQYLSSDFSTDPGPGGRHANSGGPVGMPRRAADKKGD
ncbi:nitrate reductase molybdenum cofactor assembly chaperone [Acerihabitans arboris]|uniref:Nitrate reductase molybdenum cofactor assembly chaperone n=1 Tax=Acerihabitans arboris TaxID=2691583 RepID=A0A845STJ5_9GAMM|nr:nitrate reductase molybdenum cofactor assembly chaperone [Acerihabitans arboris]NDL65801.1 nitrate reductase molybdenum cofactor assembly chaperone [Acerihabitans arboris]